MRFKLNVPTKRGVVLNGVLFRQDEKRSTDTVMIAITGIHGNFYSNPFYQKTARKPLALAYVIILLHNNK